MSGFSFPANCEGEKKSHREKKSRIKVTKIAIKEILQKKGWPKQEIQRALRIIESEEKKKKYIEFKKSSNRILYWTSILILITINILIAILLVPVLLVLKGFGLYLVIASLALIFGLIFNFLITDIEHIERKHHLIAATLIPLIAIVNIFAIVGVANRIDEVLKIPISHNPIPISFVYVFIFILPYLLSGAKIGSK